MSISSEPKANIRLAGMISKSKLYCLQHKFFSLSLDKYQIIVFVLQFLIYFTQNRKSKNFIIFNLKNS